MHPSIERGGAAVLALFAAAACGGEATDATVAPQHEPTWDERIAAAVRRRAPWPVDLLLSFTSQDFGFGDDAADLLRLEIGGDREARDALRWLFDWVDLPFRRDEPLRADQQRFAGVARLRHGLPSGFPQFLLADASGRPYATAPTLEVGGGWAWARTVAHLQDVRVRRDEHLARAAQLDGVERARELAAALAELEEGLVHTFYLAEMRAIVAAAADADPALRDRFADALVWADALPAIRELQIELSDCLSYSGTEPDTRSLLDRDLSPLHEASRRIAASNRGNRYVQLFARAIDSCSPAGHEPIEVTLRRFDPVLEAAGESRMREPIVRLRQLAEACARAAGR